MKYDLSELLNTSIITGTPVLLVEGKDDFQVYNRIATSISKTVDIYPINTIEDYASGCESVIEAVHKLQPKYKEREDNDRRIIGIIDRDVRPYRELAEGEIDYKTLTGLFILKHYSIETYFATKQNLAKIIEKHTYLSHDSVTDEIVDLVEQNFDPIKEDLYLVSLEALKNACTHDYSSVFGYDNDDLKNSGGLNHFRTQLTPRTDDLLRFAEGKALSEEDLKLICKGKWYLSHYVNTAYEKIKQLLELCRNNEIPQCRSCSTGNQNDCLYKHKTGYQPQAIVNDIMEYVDKDECSDIIRMLESLIYSNS